MNIQILRDTIKSLTIKETPAFICLPFPAFKGAKKNHVWIRKTILEHVLGMVEQGSPLTYPCSLSAEQYNERRGLRQDQRHVLADYEAAWAVLWFLRPPKAAGGEAPLNLSTMHISAGSPESEEKGGLCLC